jgi:hypothetical protein
MEFRQAASAGAASAGYLTGGMSAVQSSVTATALVTSDVAARAQAAAAALGLAPAHQMSKWPDKHAC